MSVRVKIRMSKIMRTYTNCRILHTLLSVKQIDTLKKLMKINVWKWKVSKYRVISGPYFHVFGLFLYSGPYFPVFTFPLFSRIFSVFSPNTGKYGPEIIPYLDTFHTLPTNESKKIIKKYEELWKKIRDLIRSITKN